MTDLEETRDLLKESINLHKMAMEDHAKDIALFRNLVAELMQHHDAEMTAMRQLLNDSERRITSTNEMIQSLSASTKELVSINKELKDSYVSQFESSRMTIDDLLKENARLFKETDAYYEALKREREALKHERDRYDNVMSSVINLINKSNAPMVKIDQK